MAGAGASEAAVGQVVGVVPAGCLSTVEFFDGREGGVVASATLVLLLHDTALCK
jgi:hypothetical protein